MIPISQLSQSASVVAPKKTNNNANQTNMKHQLKTVLLFLIVIWVAIIGACKKDTTHHQGTSQNTIVQHDSTQHRTDFRDSLIGKYYGATHYYYSGPPPGNPFDTILNHDTATISKDISDSGFVINGTVFTQVYYRSNNLMEYLQTEPHYSGPDVLYIYFGDSVYYLFNNDAHNSYSAYYYYKGVKIR